MQWTLMGSSLTRLPVLLTLIVSIRRRLHLIPFAITIPPAERDAVLSDKLKGELPGILAWMIKGCLDWQKRGLLPPNAVTAATTAYLEAEDSLAAWIDECCVRDANAWSSLFASWTEWAVKAGEHVGSQKRFSERLEARGIEPLRKHDGRGFGGLSLRSARCNP
jgi:putative DNA primase/helicase